MSAHTSTKRKARKEHACYWCGEPILIGEQYMDEKGIGDDGSYGYRMHVECRIALYGLCDPFWWLYSADPGIMKRGKGEER